MTDADSADNSHAPKAVETPPPADDETVQTADTSSGSVLLYGLSLPERALRAGLGVVGGVVRESATMLVPQAFQDSKTYQTLVAQTLRFVTDDIAGVKRPASEGEANCPAQVDNFAARKAVGNFVEMAGLATMHLSPLVLLAVVSDVAYGSKRYLDELTDELKRQGVIDENSTVNHAGDLLQAVSDASGTAASTFDTPPLSVDGLRDAIQQTRDAVTRIDPAKIMPQAEIEQLWDEMRDIATRENVGLTQVSGAMSLFMLSKLGTVAKGALSGVQVAGMLVDRHVIDHYRQAARQLQERGLYATLSETSGPYVEAVWHNFSSTRGTITEDLLSGKLIGTAWRGMKGWLGR